MNDRLDVAVATGAAGAHLGADDFPPDRIRTVAPRPFRVGISVGDRAEASDALEADADYWSIGPFYATGTKTDAGAPLGPEGFADLAGAAPPGVPVVAIGGLLADRVSEAVAAGAVGVAVINGIFGRADVEAATREYRDALRAAGLP